MSTQLQRVETAQGHLQSAEDIREQVNLIQKVMKAVMKEGVHYGKIPGVDKPSLFKPGAEVLASTFRLAPSYPEVFDLSGEGFYRYRITCRLTHQTSGLVMGDGMGACSSLEEKYKWRKAICDEEFEETPENKKRVKFARGKNNSFYKAKQIRTEPADIDNTVLKMGSKRAMVAAILNVTAASDIFSQDIEDLPEELRDTDGGEEQAGGQQQAQAKKPEAKPAYSEEKFKEMLPKWKDLVLNGGKKPEGILRNLNTTYTLNNDQHDKITNIATLKLEGEPQQ
jgi:hypothetical protein